MTDKPARINVQIRYTQPSGAISEQHFALDLADPELSRFAYLTDDERDRCEKLIAEVLRLWGETTADDRLDSEPLRTLLDSAVEIIHNGFIRDQSNAEEHVDA
ncbi:hypothetical protein [Candidatus Poriferisodalis sp.]|uniref:hypothetical protein n=1 Tax=Candidatus Poriferisodalis sp. TaxID=3101277 RepID=UPI003B01FEE9